MKPFQFFSTAALATFFLAGSAIAQDDCASAAGAALGANAFDTTGHTTSGMDGACSSATIHNDTFMTFTAGAAADHRFETCGAAGFDSKIRVYDTDCAGACLAYNDDACPGFLSSVTVALLAGQSVIVQVGGYGSGDSGPGDLIITQIAAPPGNDDCAGALAVALGANPFDTDLATTSGLTEPGCSTSAIHNDVFHTYTAGSDLDVSFATCGVNFDTKLRIYDVDCAGVCLGYNDDACATSIGNNYASELILSMTLGQTVVIQTGGWGSSDRGQGDLTISEIIPGNDCEGALAAALGVTSFDTTINTTSGQGDTSCFSGAMHNDIWFTYTAASDGDHSFATCGSGYDTRIKLFDGDCAGACLAYNDDACATSVGNNFASLAQVPLTTGQTVMVQISGWGAGDNGPGDLTVTELGGPPPNDACAGATVITGNTAFDNAAATTSGESTCHTSNKDLWYSFTATREGAHTFDTCSATGDTKIAVFDGACGSLVCLMANDDFCGLQSAVNPTLAIGQTVLVQVGAFGSSGVVAGDLHIHEPSLCDATGVEDAISVASANHACASAVAMPNGVFPGLVVCKDRPDFFSFVVADGATVDLEIQFPTGTADQDMFLYDAAACLDDQNSGCAGSLACGYSASDNEVISWTNTTGADMVCSLRVNIWPNDAGEVGNYQLSIAGSLDGGTSSFCSPAVANSTGASVSLGASTTSLGSVWVNATGGPDAEFGYMLISATNNDPGVSVADGMLCLTGNIGRYNSVAGVVYPDRDSSGQFVAGGTGGNTVFYTANDNGPITGAPGFLVPAELPFPPGGLISSGDVFHLQMWYRDGASSNFSDGLTVSF